MVTTGYQADLIAKVPTIALGTVQWGLDYGIANNTGRPDSAEILRIFRIAARFGLDTLDTARSYGASEEFIGANASQTDRWKVFTKLAVPNDADSASEENVRSLARLSLKESRRALKREVLDAVLLHRPEQYNTGAWDVLLEEKDQGKIAKIGYSALAPQDAWEALERSDVEVVQVAASLFDQRLLRSGWFIKAAERRIVVVVRSVFLQGAALMSPASLPKHLESLRPRIGALDALCARYETSRLDALLAAVRTLPVDFILVGCETAAQLNEILAGWRGNPVALEAITRFMKQMPDLPDCVLDPKEWPKK